MGVRSRAGAKPHGENGSRPCPHFAGRCTLILMLEPDFDPAPTAVRIYQCGYVSPCRARGCLKRALIAEKVDAAGRHVRQVELCEPHLNFVIDPSANATARYSIVAIGADLVLVLPCLCTLSFKFRKVP